MLLVFCTPVRSACVCRFITPLSRRALFCGRKTASLTSLHRKPSPAARASPANARSTSSAANASAACGRTSEHSAGAAVKICKPHGEANFGHRNLRNLELPSTRSKLPYLAPPLIKKRGSFFAAGFLHSHPFGLRSFGSGLFCTRQKLPDFFGCFDGQFLGKENCPAAPFRIK